MSTFHLPLPVKDLEATLHFYCEVLPGQQQKTTAEWFNVNLAGHQLTFHGLPEAFIDSPHLHWGLIVGWDAFYELVFRLKQYRVAFKTLPDYQDTHTAQSRMKMVFTDPSGYLIEFKAYQYAPENW